MDNQEAKGRQLLSQLERVSRSAGLLAVSYKPQQPVPTPLDVDPDLPPSVALYPVRSLAQQAEDAHCEEMETNTEIKELCRHDDRDAAHACLNADYSHFKSHRTPEDFRRLDLAPKLIVLRTAQARARHLLGRLPERAQGHDDGRCGPCSRVSLRLHGRARQMAVPAPRNWIKHTLSRPSVRSIAIVVAAEFFDLGVRFDFFAMSILGQIRKLECA